MAQQSGPGFKEHVKNPDVFRQLVKEREQVKAALSATEKELAELIFSMRGPPLEYEELQNLA